MLAGVLIFKIHFLLLLVLTQHKYVIYRGEQAKLAAQEKVEAQAAQQAAMQAIESENKAKTTTTEPTAMQQINLSAYTHRAVSFLARNFYNLKYVALVLAFCINFMLLFYKVGVKIKHS